MRKLIVPLLLTLLLSVSAMAFVQQQAFSRDVSANDLITDCQVFNYTQTYCRVFQDILTIDYFNNPDFYIGNGLHGYTFSDNGNGNYVAYINVKIDQFAKSGERYFGRVNKTYVSCDRYDNNIGVNTTSLINVYNHTDYGNGNETFNDFIKITLSDNQYARCTFNTYYINNSLFLTSSPVQWKIWKPTYKSTEQRPCQLAFFKAQDNLATCKDTQIGVSVASKEYVKTAIKVFAYNNYVLMQDMFWMFVIALMVFVIELIIIAPFLVKRIFEKILKKMGK